MSSSPLFSVLITAYNRAGQVGRAVESVRRQTFEDHEILVLDDASTDDTAQVLAAIDDPRLRVVVNPVNLGITPARAAAVKHARGQWLVVLDSDWELYPGTLQRLHELIAELPPDVRIIRGRLDWDNGEVSPPVVPDEVTGYVGRLEWLEAIAHGDGGSDAAQCIHRDVFAANPLPTDRRGVIETLWETDVARHERSLWVTDVFGLEHTDAPNSATRDRSLRRLVPRLITEASDQRWMAETMLTRHDEGLRRHAPTYRHWLLESAMLESLLCGDRRAGLRHFRAAREVRADTPQVWLTLVLGLIGPRPLATAKLAGRQLRGRIRSGAPGGP